MKFDPAIQQYLRMFLNAKGTKDFGEGDVIFEEGDRGDVMYIVLDGNVELHVAGKQVAHLDAGESFGEMALIDDSPRSATATASSQCKLAEVDADRFEEMVRDTPFFAKHIVHIMAERLRDMDKRLASTPSS